MTNKYSTNWFLTRSFFKKSSHDFIFLRKNAKNLYKYKLYLCVCVCYGTHIDKVLKFNFPTFQIVQIIDSNTRKTKIRLIFSPSS